MSKPLDRTRGYWATGERGTIQVVLFLTTLGATALNATNHAAFFIDVVKAIISMMGVAVLVGYAYHTTHLSKKEVIAPVILAVIFGLIVTIGPRILVFLVKTRMIGL